MINIYGMDAGIRIGVPTFEASIFDLQEVEFLGIYANLIGQKK